MAKILNIDSLAVPERYLDIGGKRYVVENLTVENFLITTQEAEKLKNEPDQKIQVNATIDMIMRSVPTISRELLVKVPLEKLLMIVRFIQGGLDEDDNSAISEAEDSAAKK